LVAFQRVESNDKSTLQDLIYLCWLSFEKIRKLLYELQKNIKRFRASLLFGKQRVDEASLKLIRESVPISQIKPLERLSEVAKRMARLVGGFKKESFEGVNLRLAFHLLLTNSAQVGFWGFGSNT